MCRCSSAYCFITTVSLLLPFACHLFPTLPKYQPYVYSTLLFSPATQTYCSEGEDGLEYFYEEFYACAAPVVVPVVL
jgi:hypothetical protein